MYKYVIFDVDGTLINTETTILSSLQKALTDTGIDKSMDELQFAMGIPGNVALQKLGVEDKEAVTSKWLDNIWEFRHEVTVYQGIRDVLKNLQDAGIKTGIVTSQTRDQLKGTLEFLELQNDFDTTVTSDETTHPKPDPEPLLAFLEQTNLQSNEAIYIGDTIYDKNCADGAHMDFGLALWGAKDPETIGAKLELKDPTDILNVIGMKQMR